MLKKTKILLIDDDEEFARLVKAILNDHVYEVKTATTSEDGLATAGRWQPDLIALDISMPHLDGIDLLVSLQRDDETKRIPVMMVTAMNNPVSAQMAFHYGAGSYLTKPIRPEGFLAEISHLVAPKRAKAS